VNYGFRKRRGIGLRHLARYREIISVLVKNGFGATLSALHLERYVLFGKRVLRRKGASAGIEHLSRGDRLAVAMEELGPTFIKLGQFLANRVDLLPIDIIDSLTKLQDRVRPFPSAEAKAILEQELGKKTDSLFSFFEDRPFASASMAQVHRAVLPTGETVAVKIQRPRLVWLVTADVDIIAHLATIMERYSEDARSLDLSGLVAEFEAALRNELDFTVEAMHIEHFQKNFRNDPRVYVPAVYHSFTGKRVMTTEYIDGAKITDQYALDRMGIDPVALANAAADVFLQQIFEHRFFHADPHPGNILVRPDGSLCFLDYGMMGVLSPTLRQHLGTLVSAIVNRDAGRLTRTLVRLARNPVENIEHLEYVLTELIEEYASVSLKSVRLGDVIAKTLSIIIEHRVHILPGAYVLLRALVALESICSKLDPTFALAEHLQPTAGRILRDQFNPAGILYDIYTAAADLRSLLKTLPGEAEDLFLSLKNGKLRIQFEHQGLEPFLMKNDELVTRLVYAIVLAALIIGSSIVILANVPPRLFGVPVIGVAGFVLAGIMGFGVLFSIVGRRRLWR
jgi:ubiquinone biosynthesis protein